MLAVGDGSLTEDPEPIASRKDVPIVRDPDAEILFEINSELEKASELASEGKTEEALGLCVKVLGRENLPARSAASLSLIMRKLGQTQVADKIRSVVLQGIRGNIEQIERSTSTILPTAEALDDLGARDDAERLYWRAIDISPNDPTVILAVAGFLLQQQRKDEAVTLAEEFCTRVGHQFEILLHFSTFFTYFEANEAAKRFLGYAAAQCKTKTQRTQLDFRRAAMGSPVAELDQHNMAVELFDSFADNYDSKLTILGNNGPSLILTAIEELKLPKTQTRRVLDAGCGTGLCAGFLRDYAKDLVGVDLSINMLQKAREKRLYDSLARTDLSNPATFPEGTFDMIVCADVLVYFGALDEVLRNLRRALNPGGWLLATFEDETNQSVKSGFKLYPSGRHKHSDAYLLATLSRAGFPKPRLLEHGRLRNEMTLPVLGTVMAVQKSALVVA
jgi:predicted TPR repeat methyltransferase